MGAMHPVSTSRAGNLPLHPAQAALWKRDGLAEKLLVRTG